jgi:F-type H+-transporting ATPase subunit b
MIQAFVLAEGGSSGLGALGINGLAFISQLISFIIVLVLLRVWVFPIMQRTLDKRQAIIRQGIENADQAEQKLQDAKNEADQIVLNARREAQATIERSTRNAEQISEQIQTEARDRAEKYRQQQVALIQQEANRARMDLSRDVVNLSINAASQVINRSVDTSDNRRLVEEFVTSSDSARSN